jgi:hypothetical protein
MNVYEVLPTQQPIFPTKRIANFLSQIIQIKKYKYCIAKSINNL